MGARKVIEAAEAMKVFAKKSITVRTHKSVTVKGADGIERSAYEAKDVSLAERHIIGAADYGDRVVIVTVGHCYLRFTTWISSDTGPKRNRIRKSATSGASESRRLSSNDFSVV